MHTLNMRESKISGMKRKRQGKQKQQNSSNSNNKKPREKENEKQKKNIAENVENSPSLPSYIHIYILFNLGKCLLVPVDFNLSMYVT